MMSSNSHFGSNRTLEIIRRFSLLTGALLTIWMILKPSDALFRVRDIDFTRLQKKDASRMRSDIRMLSRESGLQIDPNDPTINRAPTLRLDQYIAEKTKDRLIEVSGARWSSFFDEVQGTLSGNSSAFARHLSDSYGIYKLYFRTNESPLGELIGEFNKDKNFTYVSLHAGGHIRYLEVIYQKPQAAHSEAPGWLMYPLRKNAVWFFIIGLLVYVSIPWHRKNLDELRYSTARAIVIPDMLGIIMTSAFFALPILVITGNAQSSASLDIFGFSNGWWPLTAALWLLALCGIAIIVTALWYACFTLRISESGFGIKTLFREGEYAFAEIKAIEPAHWAWPRWLRTIAILLSFMNWRAVGPVILGSLEEAYGVGIRMRDGLMLKVWITHLPGFQRIFHALRLHNVPMDPDLTTIIDQDMAGGIPVPKSGKGGKIAASILATLTIAGLLVWQYTPEKERVVKHELQFSYEQLAQRSALMEEMQKISASMTRALELPKDASPEQRATALQQFEKLQEQYQELEKRHDAIQPEEED